MAKTILIIEDDNEINSMLRTLLKTNGFEAISAYSGTEGLLVHGDNVDLILLDLMLPGRSGDDIIGELKKKKNVPVIVMSAIHDTSKKVDLFSLGADDYITKPFGTSELLARIRMALRHARTRGANAEVIQTGKYVVGDITIDYDKRIKEYSEKQLSGVTRGVVLSSPTDMDEELLGLGGGSHSLPPWG